MSSQAFSNAKPLYQYLKREYVQKLFECEKKLLTIIGQIAYWKFALDHSFIANTYLINEITHFKKEREKLRRLAELIKFQLNPDKFPKVKFGDDVKVPVSTLQLLIKKINEEYVL